MPKQINTVKRDSVDLQASRWGTFRIGFFHSLLTKT